MHTYRIITAPHVPKYDPTQSPLRKVLGWLRLVRRARFVMLHRADAIMYCNPDSVKSLTALLMQQGYKFTVQPLLAAVPKEVVK